MFPIANIVSFSPLDQQLLRFSPLLDHVTEITCQFDFEEGNFRSGLIELPQVPGSLTKMVILLLNWNGLFDHLKIWHIDITYARKP